MSTITKYFCQSESQLGLDTTKRDTLTVRQTPDGEKIVFQTIWGADGDCGSTVHLNSDQAERLSAQLDDWLSSRQRTTGQPLWQDVVGA